MRMKKNERYAHNPHYCMIRPDADTDGDHADEDIPPTGQTGTQRKGAPTCGRRPDSTTEYEKRAPRFPKSGALMVHTLKRNKTTSPSFMT